MESIQLSNELHVLDDFPAVSYETWKAKATADLKGVPFEKKLITHTYDGLEIQPLYTTQSWPSAADPSGFPGTTPHTRGLKPLGHALDGWDGRQEVLKPTPAEANAVILEELQHGAHSVELKLDAAACNGLDADDPRAAGLCGRDGIMAYHRGDIAQTLKKVALEIAPVSVDAGAAFLPAAAVLAAEWAGQSIEASKVSGSFNANPLGVLMLHGTLPLPLDAAIAQMVDLAAWTSKRYPNITAIRVSTTMYHQAGASPVQELAYAMRTAVEYLRAMTAAGMEINTAVKQIAFHEAVGCRFFQAIAKLRALRKLWAKVATACGAENASIAAMRLSSETSRRVLTRRDPWVNLLRNTAACFAGAVGGLAALPGNLVQSTLGGLSGAAEKLLSPIKSLATSIPFVGAAFAAVPIQPNHANIGSAHLLNLDTSIVAAAVIDDDHFHLRIILPPHRIERPLDRACSIIRGDEHRYWRIRHVGQVLLLFNRVVIGIVKAYRISCQIRRTSYSARPVLCKKSKR